MGGYHFSAAAVVRRVLVRPRLDLSVRGLALAGPSSPVSGKGWLAGNIRQPLEFSNRPTKDWVMLEAQTSEETIKQIPEVRVIRRV